jgi:hypothetical protein
MTLTTLAAEEQHAAPAADLVPWMDAQGLQCFQAALAHSQCYLEYGCGGSTVYACNTARVKTVISIESSRDWVDKLRALLAGTPSTLLLAHCDIGEVGDWGVPKSKDRVNDFWRYMVAPWQLARQHHHQPDTVLVDGRFRVASFLFSLLSARVGTTILFDDYLDRPEYFVVEQFCRLQEAHGRMGVFTAGPGYSTVDLCACIAEYSLNWD